MKFLFCNVKVKFGSVIVSGGLSRPNVVICRPKCEFDGEKERESRKIVSFVTSYGHFARTFGSLFTKSLYFILVCLIHTFFMIALIKLFGKHDV